MNILTSNFTKPFHLLLPWLEPTSSHFNFLDAVTFPFYSDRFFRQSDVAVLPSETHSGLWSETSVIGGLLALPDTNMWHVDEIRLDEPVGMVNRIFIISTGAPTQIAPSQKETALTTYNQYCSGALRGLYCKEVDKLHTWRPSPFRGQFSAKQTDQR